MNNCITKVVIFALQINKNIEHMKTSYKVITVEPKYTVVYEYWDALLIYKYTVFDSYRGGNIEQFIRDSDLCRTVIWDGLNEFLRRTNILDS